LYDDIKLLAKDYFKDRGFLINCKCKLVIINRLLSDLPKARKSERFSLTALPKKTKPVIKKEKKVKVPKVKKARKPQIRKRKISKKEVENNQGKTSFE